MTTAQRRRILVLSPFPPRPDGMHGGSRVIGQFLERLAERHEVGAVYLRAPDEPPASQALLRTLALCEEVRRPDRQSAAAARALGLARGAAGLFRGTPLWASDWSVPAFAVQVRKLVRGWRPELVQAEFHLMGQYLGEPRGDSPVRVLVNHEPGAAAAADRAELESGARRLARRVDEQVWRRFERRLLQRADAVVTFTQRDLAALSALEPSARIVCIRPGVPIPPQPLNPRGIDPPRVLFLGNFVHPPNVEAAVRLAEAIFPAVRAACPRATLEIVGEGPTREVRRLAGPGIAVTGAVADPRRHLDRAAVVAVPMRLGGGIRVKVLEALAAGKAVVASPRALAGIDPASGEHVIVAETDAEFSDAIVALLRDDERRARLARTGGEWARAHLRWDEALAAYESLYASLLG